MFFAACDHTEDAPLALLYLVDESGEQARLEGAAGIRVTQRGGRALTTSCSCRTIWIDELRMPRP
jgi:hypothetical protein